MTKLKEEDLKKEGTVSIADVLKDAGKIANKDAQFVANYLRHIRRELIDNSLTFKVAVGNIDTIVGMLDGLRVMVERLFLDPDAIKKGDKLFIHSSWDIPIGGKMRNIFDKIERDVLKKAFGSIEDDGEMAIRNKEVNALTKGIVAALKEQKEYIEADNKMLKERGISLRLDFERMRGMNEAIKEVTEALNKNKKE